VVVLVGRVCTKQRVRLDRLQVRFALVTFETGAMRRVQAPIRECLDRRPAV
jgi:hypothetical protein